MRPAAGSGFTLIETLVALVVAATVAAAVVSLVNGLYRRALQSRMQTDVTIALINDSVMVRAGDWRSGTMEYNERWRLHPYQAGAPQLLVENIELSGSLPPPLAVAHTPFQRFGVRQGERILWFIAPAMPPPGGNLAPNIPANPGESTSPAGTRRTGTPGNG